MAGLLHTRRYRHDMARGGGSCRAKKAEVCARRCASVDLLLPGTRMCLAAAPNHCLTMSGHSACGSAPCLRFRFVNSIGINDKRNDTATEGLEQLSHSVEHVASVAVWRRVLQSSRGTRVRGPRGQRAGLVGGTCELAVLGQNQKPSVAERIRASPEPFPRPTTQKLGKSQDPEHR